MCICYQYSVALIFGYSMVDGSLLILQFWWIGIVATFNIVIGRCACNEVKVLELCDQPRYRLDHGRTLPLESIAPHHTGVVLVLVSGC